MSLVCIAKLVKMHCFWRLFQIITKSVYCQIFSKTVSVHPNLNQISLKKILYISCCIFNVLQYYTSSCDLLCLLYQGRNIRKAQFFLTLLKQA
jgi:hypothetical protein